MPGASDLPVSVTEKMLRSRKRFGRSFSRTEADMEVRASRGSLPRFGRAPKAEIYSSKSGKGLAWQRSKKFTHENSKSKQCSWRRPAASRLHRSPENWVFPTRLFTNGA